MTKYQPAYPIVHSSDMKPRDQIKIVPELELDPITRAELSNLRAEIPYKFTIADTPQNRENFNFKALYFQLAAYKEGWEFRPENLQVIYLPPGDPRLPQDEHERRIFEFGDEAANQEVPLLNLPHRISPTSRLGFKINEHTDLVTQIRPEETDDLGGRVLNLFRKR